MLKADKEPRPLKLAVTNVCEGGVSSELVIKKRSRSILRLHPEVGIVIRSLQQSSS